MRENGSYDNTVDISEELTFVSDDDFEPEDSDTVGDLSDIKNNAADENRVENVPRKMPKNVGVRPMGPGRIPEKKAPSNSSRNAKANIAANGGVKVHKKPIVKVDDPSDIQDEEYADENTGDRVTAGSLGIIEKAMIIMAVCVILLLVVVGVVFVATKNKSDSTSTSTATVNENGLVFHQELAGAGGALAGIDVIGGDGIAAELDVKKAAVLAAEEAAKEQEKNDEDEDSYDETDYANNVTIAFETVSVVKDLKVKLINKKTGKLIANIPFELTVTTPNGNTMTWTDSDKDGIIYYSDLTAGTYTLHMAELDEEKYKGYTLPDDAKSEVKAEIAYEKVNVADEILNAKDVNEATEDTARDGAGDEGTTLSDTVAWVESSSSVTYTALDDNSAVNAPFLMANLDYGNVVIAKAVDYNSDASLYSMTLSSDSVTVNAGEQTSVTLTLTGIDEGSVTAASADTGIATVSKSGTTITITGVSAGSTAITVSQTVAEGDTAISSKQINVTVNAAVPASKGSIATEKTAVSVLKGYTGSVAVTLTDLDASGVTVTSSNTGVATAVLSSDGKTLSITGVSAGSATITLTSTADTTVNASVAVTICAWTEKLTGTVDGKSVQLYVRESNGNYREAVYIDYTANPTFYYANGTYTGWQTIGGSTYYYTAEGKAVTGEQVIKGVKYNFDSTGALVTGTGTLGIDISKWNGTINWSKVKASGVSYVIIRVGYRGSSQGGLIDDSNFKTNIEGAIAAGLKVGVYFVTQAVNDSEAVYEASMVLDRISGYKISYPVFLDVEASGGRGDKIDAATRTSVCRTFCKTIQNAGYTAGIYANKTWLTSKIDTSQLGGYKIWVAQYNSSCTYSGSYNMWQYTDSGTIDGISGNVDLNQSYLGY